MKGTDCTPEQLANARDFLCTRGWNPAAPKAVLTLEDASRLLAWYGAIRYIAARDGIGGTLEKPGVIVSAQK